MNSNPKKDTFMTARIDAELLRQKVSFIKKLELRFIFSSKVSCDEFNLLGIKADRSLHYFRHPFLKLAREQKGNT